MSVRQPLHTIAHGRSGDKGSHANIGIIAYTPQGFAFLRDYLTAERVAAYFAPLRPARVERFELPGIQAFNFLLHQVLQGGASQSLRTDSQGKVLALALLEMEVELPPDWQVMRGEASTGGEGR